MTCKGLRALINAIEMVNSALIYVRFITLIYGWSRHEKAFDAIEMFIKERQLESEFEKNGLPMK